MRGPRERGRMGKDAWQRPASCILLSVRPHTMHCSLAPSLSHFGCRRLQSEVHTHIFLVRGSEPNRASLWRSINPDPAGETDTHRGSNCTRIQSTSPSSSNHCLIQLPEAVETPAAPTPPPPNHPFLYFCFAVSGANCDTKTSGDDAGSQWITRTTGSTGRQKTNRQEQLQRMSQAEKMQAQEHDEEQSSDLEVRRFLFDLNFSLHQPSSSTFFFLCCSAVGRRSRGSERRRLQRG